MDTGSDTDTSDMNGVGQYNFAAAFFAVFVLVSPLGWQISNM